MELKTALVKSAKRLLKPVYRLAPEALKNIYREFRREYPLVDRSQVVRFIHVGADQHDRVDLDKVLTAVRSLR